MSSVTCMVCQKEFKHVVYGHLRTHGMTVAEYKKKFPLAKLTIGVGCFRKGNVPWNKGKKFGPNPEISKRMKDLFSDTQWKKDFIDRNPVIGKSLEGKENPFYGHHHTDKLKEDLSKQRQGVHMSNTQNSFEGMLRVRDELLLYKSHMEDEGYRVIPLHHFFPVPDLIAIKDGQVIAVEIGKVKREKYKNYPYYDQVLLKPALFPRYKQRVRNRSTTSQPSATISSQTE